MHCIGSLHISADIIYGIFTFAVLFILTMKFPRNRISSTVSQFSKNAFDYFSCKDKIMIDNKLDTRNNICVCASFFVTIFISTWNISQLCSVKVWPIPSTYFDRTLNLLLMVFEVLMVLTIFITVSLHVFFDSIHFL